MPSFVTATTTTAGINKLPPEILMKIFSMLDNKDLGKVLRVCTQWRDVGECLWNWHILVIGRDDLDMMGIKRVEHVEELMVENDDEWSEKDLIHLFESLTTRLKKITYLGIFEISLSSLCPRLFVEAVMDISFVGLSSCELTMDQMNMLLDKIDENSKLKSLAMGGVDMSHVDPNLLAVGVNQLEFVHLYGTQLTVEQVTALLRVAGDQTKLHSLFLEGVSGKVVDPEILEKAKDKIERTYIN